MERIIECVTLIRGAIQRQSSHCQVSTTIDMDMCGCGMDMCNARVFVYGPEIRYFETVENNSFSPYYRVHCIH